MSGAEPEAAYYQAVEEFFVARRGDPLFLSNADWLLIRRWRQAGTPLRVVLRGIADALDSHAHSWGRARKVGSLAYCAAEVDAARERWERALSLGSEPGVETSAVLAGFAEALAAARDMRPSAAKFAVDLAGELRARSGEPGAPRDLEDWLGRREAALLETLRSETPDDALAGIEAAVDADLAPYRDRMPARVLGQVRADAIARRLLESHALPRLSLFHL